MIVNLQNIISYDDYDQIIEVGTNYLENSIKIKDEEFTDEYIKDITRNIKSLLYSNDKKFRYLDYEEMDFLVVVPKDMPYSPFILKYCSSHELIFILRPNYVLVLGKYKYNNRRI